MSWFAVAGPFGISSGVSTTRPPRLSRTEQFPPARKTLRKLLALPSIGRHTAKSSLFLKKVLELRLEVGADGGRAGTNSPLGFYNPRTAGRDRHCRRSGGTVAAGGVSKRRG